jgi:NAD(P)-dependent dehydrogenase (short-subunit alcohol dehydrogenase family)
MPVARSSPGVDTVTRVYLGDLDRVLNKGGNQLKLKPIRDQVVVVMGASSGIGRQTALDFAARGAKVVGSAREKDGLASLRAEAVRAGGELTAAVADTSDFDQVRRVADLTAETYGRIDTWVQCAAVELYATFEQTTPEEWQRVIDVNLNGQAFGAMAALPYIRRAGGGALIHVSSLEARRAFPYQSAYAASKHGITGMLEALRLELKNEGAPISVTEILPATINTPLFDKARTKIGVKPTGMPPIYDPKLVSDAILHAAEHPVREFVVGGSGKLMKWTQDLAPAVAGRFVLNIGFEGQKTKEAKAESAPDNLFEPIEGHDQVQGTLTRKPHNTAAFHWADKHPLMSRLIMLGALSAAAALAFRESNQREAQ